jgi:hypothetical protein
MNWLFEMRALRMPHPSNASRTRVGEIDLACGALPNHDCSWVDFSEKTARAPTSTNQRCGPSLGIAPTANSFKTNANRCVESVDGCGLTRAWIARIVSPRSLLFCFNWLPAGRLLIEAPAAGVGRP